MEKADGALAFLYSPQSVARTTCVELVLADERAVHRVVEDGGSMRRQEEAWSAGLRNRRHCDNMASLARPNQQGIVCATSSDVFLGNP